MWKYVYANELYHFGVLGMKWGVRKSNKNQKSKAGIIRKYKSSDNEDALKEEKKQKLKNISKARKIATGTKMAALALNTIGQYQYNKYRNNASPNRVAVIRGLGYSAKALNTIGNVSMLHMYGQLYDYGKAYWFKR